MNNDKITELPIDDIVVDQNFNCRDGIKISDIMELASQIKQMGFLIQPLVVRMVDNKPHLVAGFRRWHACKRLKWEKVPCVIHTKLSELDAASINIAENIERKDLTPLEEARAINKLLEQGYSGEDIGKKLQRSPTWLASRLAILDLPPDVQDEVARGILSLKQVRYLVDLPKDLQYEAIRKIKERKAALETDKAIRFVQNIEEDRRVY
jgi:ParB family chromosome partitioning protein